MNRQRTAPLVWDVDVPLMTNHMVGALAKAMIGASAIVAALVSLLLATQGAWEVIPRMASLLIILGCALFLFGLVVMLFPFRNRLATRYTIDAEGVRLSVTDSTARAGSRLSFLLGLVLGNSAAAGGGILATTQQEQAVRWDGSFRGIFEPATRSIAFYNGWRTLMRVYCLPDNYDAAVELVSRQMAQHGTASRVSARSPIGAYLSRTLLVLLASLPLFAISDIYGFSLLPPLLLLCFGVAMVWFVRQLAWIVLGIMVIIFALVLSGAYAERTSYTGRAAYLRYEILSGDDWALTVLAIAGAVVIGWLAIATLMGKIKPALTQDMIDAGEASE